MDKVTADLPAQNVNTAGWMIPKDVFLADPSFNKCQPIDLVIGAKHFYALFPTAARMQLQNDLPLLIDSVFGWIVAGSATEDSYKRNTAPTRNVVAVSMITLEESLEQFWKMEDLTTKDNFSVEERHCESLYQTTVARNHKGRYIVRLPRKPDFDVLLGKSKANALRRFTYLEARLERNFNLKFEYHQFMKEYLSLGHMQLVEPNDDSCCKAYYSPHHPVVKESSTSTRVRVVFDGSAKTSSGYSLNDALCVGPVVQDDLLTIILRFRSYPIALVGDVEKMYRQVLVHPIDAPFQRILWRFSPDNPIQTYELRTVTYGLALSSFLATRTLRQQANDEATAESPPTNAARKMLTRGKPGIATVPAANHTTSKTTWPIDDIELC
ncbi:uncharacterized protein LOC131428890 [Malaya genurostris]|uniref:uncharacterized protein LOC131428890 n=1 Tax=Malaya genurostris TaxID=325434 RepID=UPI0026F38118|nr:uncharacterized protein LOC131428890 [Malaya genurostris]